MDPDTPPTLLGRERELAVLDQLVESVRAGRGQGLVIRGEAGIGKTALLGELDRKAEGFIILRGRGVESEADLPYAAVQRMCAQVEDDHFFDRDGPQVQAVKAAFGMEAGPRPDPFLVGLGILTRVAEASTDRPLICLVDDAQWLDRDSAQVLALATRRLEADAAAIVFAEREPTPQLRDLPELRVSRLSAGDSRSLLASGVHGPLDESVRDRFIAEAHGNPLALLELPRGSDVLHLIGGRGESAIGGSHVAELLDASFRSRYEDLPSETRQLLLVAAAEPTGAPDLLWNAAERLGIAPDALGPAEGSGLISVAERSVFRHPAVRTSVYRSATPEARRRTHLALAEATDPEVDFDRRAWHRGLGVVGFDADIADELAGSAARAQARGGMATSAGFLAKAAILTPDPRLRGERALAAAHFSLMVGAADDAAELLAMAEAAPLDPLGLARLDLARALEGLAGGRPREVVALLLKAARRLEQLEPALSTRTLMEAFGLADFTAAERSQVVEVAQAILDRPSPEVERRRLSHYPLMVAGARLTIDGYADGAAALAEALATYRADVESYCNGGDIIGDGSETRWLSMGIFSAIALWDLDMWEALSGIQIRLIRRGGELSMLPVALNFQVILEIYKGNLTSAKDLISEIEVLTGEADSQLPRYGAIAIAARQNRADAVELLRAGAERAESRGESLGLAFLEGEAAHLKNALGHYDEALRHARNAARNPTQNASMWLADLIEAAVRSGEPEAGRAALVELTALADSVESGWAKGVASRSRALLADGEAAEDAYRASIDLLGRTPARLDLARARLLFGEWLRREGRRREARDELRAAHQAFEAIEVAPYTERAARELAATGERVRRRTPERRDELTDRESQIARLAAQGLSNRQIGEQLYISHRTVGYHLGKVFAKLEVENRAQLNSALGTTS